MSLLAIKKIAHISRLNLLGIPCSFVVAFLVLRITEDCWLISTLPLTPPPPKKKLIYSEKSTTAGNYIEILIYL